MSHPAPQRGPITDYLLAQLTTELAPTVLVGDGIAPDGGGWLGTDVGSGNFTGYIVVATGPGRPVPPTSIGNQGSDAWALSYTVTSYGGVRAQCDNVADLWRSALQTIDLSKTVDLNQLWRFERRAVESYGAVERRDVSQGQAFWAVVDQATIVITKRRT